MYLKNNSHRAFKDYDCGCGVITVEPLSVMEVSIGIGQVLLKNLGADAWLTQINKEEFEALKEDGMTVSGAKEEEVEEEVVAFEAAEEMEEELNREDPIEEIIEEVVAEVVEDKKKTNKKVKK